MRASSVRADNKTDNYCWFSRDVSAGMVSRIVSLLYSCVLEWIFLFFYSPVAFNQGSASRVSVSFVGL